MQFLRHRPMLFRSLFGSTGQNKAWWIVPIVVVLLALAAVMIVGHAVAPFIYTLF